MRSAQHQLQRLHSLYKDQQSFFPLEFSTPNAATPKSFSVLQSYEKKSIKHRSTNKGLTMHLRRYAPVSRRVADLRGDRRCGPELEKDTGLGCDVNYVSLLLFPDRDSGTSTRSFDGTLSHDGGTSRFKT
ncbi:hypothetical protein EVAR_85477_1 [Eumeta japonica]|uniref:Uncharacterized protein n=1 Tax=Eumeta variegata TaxID=151549 RepID=A0A4C1VCH5_EUMVA|nr:hypothetical protein EVAR_85477_1 [Eumeta japonica]